MVDGGQPVPDTSTLYDDEWWLERPHDEAQQSQGDQRSPLERDRDRIFHARAFRRLSGKTQVIGMPWAYDFRNRLTHTLEVTQVGRSLARKHGIDETLVESACLAHDIGHPPFGHAGERRLNALMQDFGGFDANAQTLRVLRKLEVKGGGRPGLNLTRAGFWAVLKYPYQRDGEVPQGVDISNDDDFVVAADGRTLTAQRQYLYDDDLQDIVRDGRPFGEWLGDGKINPSLSPQSRLNAPPRRILACQVMDRADDLAYAIHDFEDAALAGFISKGGLRRVEAPLFEAVRERAADAFDGDEKALKSAFDALQREIGGLLDAVQEANDPEAVLRPNTRQWFGALVDAVEIEAPKRPDPTTTAYRVRLPIPKQRVLVSMLARLGFELMIRDERVVRYLRKGTMMLERSFEELMDDPRVVDERVGQLMPRHLAVDMKDMSDGQRARAVCDFLASMTEPGLAHFYGTLFETSGGSPFY